MVVGLVFLMVGFGSGAGGGAAGEDVIGENTGGKGAEGWVYPVVGLATVGIIGGVVGVVRRIGV